MIRFTSELVRHERHDGMQQLEERRDAVIEQAEDRLLLRGVAAVEDRLAGFEIPVAELAPNELIQNLRLDC